MTLNSHTIERQVSKAIDRTLARQRREGDPMTTAIVFTLVGVWIGAGLLGILLSRKGGR